MLRTADQFCGASDAAFYGAAIGVWFDEVSEGGFEADRGL